VADGVGSSAIRIDTRRIAGRDSSREMRQSINLNPKKEAELKRVWALSRGSHHKKLLSVCLNFIFSSTVNLFKYFNIPYGIVMEKEATSRSLL
jgi:hypothetical protein